MPPYRVGSLGWANLFWPALSPGVRSRSLWPLWPGQAGLDARRHVRILSSFHTPSSMLIRVMCGKSGYMRIRTVCQKCPRSKRSVLVKCQLAPQLAKPGVPDSPSTLRSDKMPSPVCSVGSVILIFVYIPITTTPYIGCVSVKTSNTPYPAAVAIGHEFLSNYKISIPTLSFCSAALCMLESRQLLARGQSSCSRLS
jgi:hypothetical protein